MTAPLWTMLQKWRDADHEDAITLTRNDVIGLLEERRAPEVLAADATVQAMVGAAFRLAAQPRTYEDYRNAAIHYRHDYGLLPRLDQVALCREAEYWHHALAHQTEALTPADAASALARLLAEERKAALEEAAKVAGDAAVEVLLRHDPDAGPLKKQTTRQAVAKPIRALKGTTP